MSDADVTHWLNLVQAGDPAAAQPLWERYFRRLVGLARGRLQALPRRAAADEEDVALSAFDSFCRGAAAGRFPQLGDRDDLWRLLATITARKAQRLVRAEHRQKRGGGRVQGESALTPPGEPGAGAGLDWAADDGPTPEFAAQVAEEYCALLARLGDDQLRAIAQRKLEGYTNREIAEQLGCAPATVERRLALIRRLWQEPADEAPAG
jgi:DNA-directed RNA polymerase specialized sigma24 family protein